MLTLPDLSGDESVAGASKRVNADATISQLLYNRQGSSGSKKVCRIIVQNRIRNLIPGNMIGLVSIVLYLFMKLYFMNRNRRRRSAARRGRRKGKWRSGRTACRLHLARS